MRNLLGVVTIFVLVQSQSAELPKTTPPPEQSPPAAEMAEPMQQEEGSVVTPELPQPEAEVEEKAEPEVQPPTRVLKKKIRKKRKRTKNKKTATSSTPAGVGLSVGSPAGLSLDIHYHFTKKFGIRSGMSVPFPLTVGLKIPQLATDSFLGFRAILQSKDVDVNVIYGPHAFVDGTYHPFDGAFYLFGGGGVRMFFASMEDTFDVKVCSGGATTCAGKPIPVKLSGSLAATSLLLRGGFGWFWNVGDSGFLRLDALGLSVPLGSPSYSTNIDGKVAQKSGITILDNALDAALDNLIDRYRPALEEEIDDQMATLATAPLPIIGISGGIRF